MKKMCLAFLFLAQATCYAKLCREFSKTSAVLYGESRALGENVFEFKETIYGKVVVSVENGVSVRERLRPADGDSQATFDRKKNDFLRHNNLGSVWLKKGQGRLELENGAAEAQDNTRSLEIWLKK